MSLQVSSSGPKRSLYFAIALAMAIALLVSFVAFGFISDRNRSSYELPIFDGFDEVELQSAIKALNDGGVPALQEYLSLLDRSLRGGTHYLLDASGTDLVTGENKSYLLPKPPALKRREQVDDRWLIAHGTADGKYFFAVDGDMFGPNLWIFLPYYFVALIVIGVLCWLASTRIVWPIRKTAASIRKFGQGDLSVRINSPRHDEIGELSDAFDRMAARLQVLIRSERRLLEDISHELRGPLARLKFAVKLAKEKDPGANQDALQRIDRDVDRLGSLVNDLLEITAVEGDPAHQNKTWVSSKAIAEEVASDCALDATAQGCEIHLQAVDVSVSGNAELLRRAVENVLRNAIRYAPPSSVVDLNLERLDGKLLITVRDRGPGVPSEMLPRIFEPFFRVDPARESLNGTGSGLGLSIAKRAVEAHHGLISAENASPGLRVRITLPLDSR